jgi:Segregation and condensation complex subunit ScpB
LNPGSINYIVKKLLGNAGLEKEAYSAHSLRMGFIRGAVADDISDRKIMRQSGLKTHTMIDRYSGAVKLDRGTTDAVRGESERMPETKEPRVVEGKPPEAPSQEHQSSGEKQREIPRSEAEPAYAEGLEMEEASSLNNMSKFEAPQVEADRLPFELIPETKEPCEGQAKPPETPSQVHVSGREQQLAEWFEMEEASRSIKSKLEAPQIEADRLSPRRALKPNTEEQIETLAVIALMQPITGAHIATVRGAESWTSIKCLAKRGLIAFIKINKVHHWQVTQSCLDRLNLVSVEDLFHEQIFEKTFPMLASNRG